MSSAPAPALPDTPLIERQLQMLSRLAEAGLEIALVIQRKVEEAEAAESLAVLTAAAQAYDRVARAVRLAILLQNELIKGRPDPDHDRRREQHRDRATHIVRRVARDHCDHDPFAVFGAARRSTRRRKGDRPSREARAISVRGRLDFRPLSSRTHCSNSPRQQDPPT